MATLTENARAALPVFRELRNAMQGLAEETERIVRAQQTGLQQAQAQEQAEREAALVGRREGSSSGVGGILSQADADAIIGLLVSAISAGGGGHASPGPGFQPGPPVLRGATFARSLALSGDGGAFARLSGGLG